VPICIGGASCSGRLGPSLLEVFPQIDYTINGEGERPLLGLLRYLQGKIDTLPGAVCGRTERAFRDDIEKDQVPNLDFLPVPDFDDYFEQLDQILKGRSVSPVLPVEFSRGCWWRRCNFCNLNLQWSGYRAKSLKKVVSEIDYLSRHYGVLDFAFMDNALPRRYAASLFHYLAGHNRDYSVFAELRAVHSRDELVTMARGGLKDIQVGIESLSTSLLKRINKGVRAIDNVAIMRHAEEVGIRLDGNLIMHFPGSTQEEVEQTIEALDFVWPFRPLNTVSFWLGLGSPVEQRPSDFGISGIRPHPFFACLFPEEIYH
jgi:ribosomal peptide maturation radical SAM protein 1